MGVVTEGPRQVAIGNSNQVEARVDEVGVVLRQAIHHGQVQAVVVVNG